MNTSTIFLKGVVVLFGSAVLALCIFILPQGITSNKVGAYLPILIGMYIPAIPFFIGIYHAFKLLQYIDKNKAFSKSSLKSLKIIRYCGVIISVFYGAALPYIYYVAQLDDAPGVMLLGLIFTFAPLLVAVIAGVLEKLFHNAMSVKSENELTV